MEHRRVGTPALLSLLFATIALLYLLFSPSVIYRKYSDFSQYYAASWRLLNARNQLYNQACLTPEMLPQIDEKFCMNASHPNPPLMLLHILPLALIPYNVALAIFLAISISTIAISNYLFARHLDFPKSRSSMVSLMSVVNFPSITFHLLHHVEFLIVPLLVVGIISYRRQHYTVSSLVMSWAGMLKLFPLFWLLHFLKKTAWKSLFKGACLPLCLTFAMVWFIGEEVILRYIQVVIPATEKFHHSFGNMSITSFLSLIVGPNWVLPGNVAACVLTVGLFFYYRTSSDRFLVTTAGSLLLSPLGWSYYFILLFPVLVLISTRFSYPFRNPYFLFLCVSLQLWPSLLGGFNPMKDEWWFTMLNYVPMFGLIALMFFPLLVEDSVMQVRSNGAEDKAAR